MAAKPIPPPAPLPTDLSVLCAAILEHTPLSMATVEGANHLVRYVNPAFCRLIGKNREELIGKPFADIIPQKDTCLALMDRVYRWGQPESHTEQNGSAAHPLFWSYTAWPVLGAADRPVGVMLQVTETTKSRDRSAEMTEALMVGAVRQHELLEAGDQLNAQLQEEINQHEKTNLSQAEKARLLDLTNDAIIVRDFEERILYWNRGAEELYGWPRNMALGKTVHSLLQTQFPKPFDKISEELRQNDRWNGELVQTTRDGRRIRVIARKALDRDRHGNPAVVLESMTNITERKQAEEALGEQARLLNLSNDAIIVRDSKDRIIYWNHGAEALYGWTREEALGKAVHALLRNEFPKPLEQIVTELHQNNHWIGELVQTKRDGQRITVLSRWALDRDKEGRPAGVVAVNTDITERKRADEALHQSETRLRLLVEGSPNAMVMANDAGAITLVNSQTEKIFGYIRDELLGQKLEVLVPERYRAEHPRLRAGFVQAPSARPMGAGRELFGRRKDGSEVPVEIGLSPLQIEERTFVLATITDISQRKQAEAALREAQALLADRAALLEKTVQERTATLKQTIGELEYFSYTITHDMRAPLRAMQGFAGLLVSESAGFLPPASADYLNRITEGARRMDALIRDALQYTKILTGEIPLVSVEPASLLRGILESYPTLQPAQVSVQIVEPLPPVVANEAGLLQCFSNLLDNAIKFVPPGVQPQVRIWAEELLPSKNPTIHQSNNPVAAAWVRFWVEDNGIGIPQEFHEGIFGMFQQLDKGYAGTGIGLALVRKAVERMGGRVGVESEPGKGSRFWLEFRKAQPPNPPIH